MIFIIFCSYKIVEMKMKFELLLKPVVAALVSSFILCSCTATVKSA